MNIFANLALEHDAFPMTMDQIMRRLRATHCAKAENAFYLRRLGEWSGSIWRLECAIKNQGGVNQGDPS